MANVIQNPSFDLGTINWYSTGLFTIDLGAAKVVATLNNQLQQANLNLEPYTKYNIKFKARSLTGLGFSVALLKDISPYTNYGLLQNVTLTTTMQQFSFSFVTSGFSLAVSDARLMFYFDKGSDTFYIDDVILEKEQLNIIQNPGFDLGTTNWTFFTDGVGTFIVETGMAKVNLTTAGTNNQLSQINIPLEANSNYTLRFDAKSNTGKGFYVGLIKHITPYTNYGLYQVMSITTTLNTYTVNFITSGFSIPVSDGRLMFFFDQGTDIFYIDNVILMKTCPALTLDVIY